MNRSPLLLAIFAVLAGCEDAEDGTACMPLLEEEKMCPAPQHFAEQRLKVQHDNDGCYGYEVVEVTGQGTPADVPSWDTPRCCYPVKFVRRDRPCASDGRPYYDAGQALVAPLRQGRAGVEPRSPAIAAAWARAGAAEHASVAAFARLSLELMALGAPIELLRDVHQAAIDEVGHAAQCWQIAEREGGEAVSAAEFPIRDVKLASSLAALAASAVREGCLAETLGAQVLTSVAALAPDPEIGATLAAIAREEVTHAVLSFRIVAWALQVGGADVRAAVRDALRAPWPILDTEDLALRAGLSPELVAQAATRARIEVLAPAAARLLAA